VSSEAIQLTIMALALVLGGAAEELLPNWLGVGFPVLLAASHHFSMRRSGAIPALLFAVAAGAMEDALSSLSAMTSVSYFLLTAATCHWTGLPRGAMLLTYPFFQVWLYLFGAVGAQGGIFARLLLALPIGLVTELAVWTVLDWTARKAAADGRE